MRQSRFLCLRMLRRIAMRHYLLPFLLVAGIIAYASIYGMHSDTNYVIATIKIVNSSVSDDYSSPAQPHVSVESCLRLVRQENVSQLRQTCRPFLRNETVTAKKTVMDVHSRATPNDYVSCVAKLSNCIRFRSALGYIDHVTPEELEFPIAFGLLTYENFEQTERLLRLIYRPHNIYCLHVDAKSPAEFHTAADAVASCLPNVIVARPATKVQWGQVSVVEAELNCIKHLLSYDARWKYYINVVGRDFPLRTNRELVDILKAYNGANDVDGSRKNQYYPDWFQNSWKSLYLQLSRKTPPPHGFFIAKGSTHMAATRAFVDFALNDRKAKDLLYWMRDIKVPDEHFFQTLNHNPQLKIPGSFRGDPDLKQSFARVKRWSFQEGVTCAGTFVRWICNIGVGDLPWVTESKHLFVNKIRLEMDPMAYRCLEMWYNDRTVVPSGDNYMPEYRFDLSFYARQPFALNHVS